MSFQIHALDPEPFAELFSLSETELKERNICRMEVTSETGIPCRISLEDAQIGDTVLLLNYEHQPAQSPYRASHAIFVRQGVARAKPKEDEVPSALRSRLISVRPFDHGDMLQDPNVVVGEHLQSALQAIFDCKENIAYVHLHYAKAGCFAAKAYRG